MKQIFAMPFVLFAATFSVRPLPQEEGALEPSIQNEVDHAVDRAGAWLGKTAATNALWAVEATNACALARLRRTNLFSTNGLTREKIALKLISGQKGEGWWLTPTNAAPTRLAIEILKGL